MVDGLDVAVVSNLRRAARLRQAILKRAFEGRLVPQDPTDEPAAVLLERIRAEREGAAHPARGEQARSPEQKVMGREVRRIPASIDGRC